MTGRKDWYIDGLRRDGCFDSDEEWDYHLKEIAFISGKNTFTHRIVIPDYGLYSPNRSIKTDGVTINGSRG
jgi:hypothetical protein